MSQNYDDKKWSPATSEEPDGGFSAALAHWNGRDWLCVWRGDDVRYKTRSAALTAAIRKARELEAAGYQRPAAVA